MTRVERKRMRFSANMAGRSSDQTRKKNLTVFGICLAVMLAALIGAACYKRRK